jgi:Dehydrogenases with different specificities (related to short-chain alcohol dehydrogenases)
MTSPSGLKDLIVVVTGAGSGIGRATAMRLAEDGATVVAADINASSAEATAKLIEESGHTAHSAVVDIADSDSVAAFHESVLNTVGRCDVLVNNAGWEDIRPFKDTTREFWERILSINLLGPIAVSHAFLVEMMERGTGTIVNVGSDAGRVGSTGETVYSGAKGGIIAFTKSLAREMARYGLSVNCVCPGPTDTPAFERVPDRLKEALIRSIPLRRLAAPEDVANAISFFASPRSSYLTGQVLSVSGGLTMVD